MDILKRNNISIAGTGTVPIIFAHGFIGDQTLWRHVAPSFFEDFQVILFDYVGSGKSDKAAYDKSRYRSLEGYARDLMEICQALTLDKPVFVGHSVSGIIGLIAAIQGVKFASMVMVAPSPRYINDINYHGGFDESTIKGMVSRIDHDYETWARELAPQVINKSEAPESVDELIEKLMTADHKVAMNFARATFFADYRKDLLKLKTPTLVLQCQQDIMAPLEVGEYLNAHLENCTLRQLQAKGHFPQLSAPLEVAESIREYLLGG
ncbi:MAG TPA: alpha/beta hydrolase [Chryseosolibacter sp.]